MTDLLRDELQSALSDRYVIERELGRGGMATVYLARDLKHERNVALKLLNPDLGAVLGAERFLSEIRVTANLQHPHLLPLFDSGETKGLLWYVMPYVEGESLRARLEREKQLPVDEAVRIAVAIANALDHAHGHGIIHRDLKPENILLQHDQPVVADFGIALAVSNAGGTRVTQTGLSLGTPLYMSPEQATGDRTIDKRADIYSLGAMTYEMLAGEPPHVGNTAQAIIARLMTEDPRALTLVRRNVPAHVEAAVHRALEKLPADRFATAREFADALQGRVLSTTSATRTRAAPKRRWPSIALNAALAVAALAAGVAWWRSSNQPPPAPIRYSIDPPEGMTVSDRSSGMSIAITRDGRAVAYCVGLGRQCYVRRLDQLTATALPKFSGTDLHFSEDGRQLALYVAGGIAVASVDPGDAGGEPRILVNTTWHGLSWEHGRDVVWAYLDTLWRVSPNGGKPTMIAQGDDAGQISHPWVLPGGDMIAVRVVPRGAAPGGAGDRLGLISLDGAKRTFVDLPFQNVVGYANGVLVFGQTSGRVAAVRLDIGTGTMRGEPMTVVDNVSFKTVGGAMAAMGDDGTLVYLLGANSQLQQIVDEKGNVVDALPDTNVFAGPGWSPDGMRVATGMTRPGDSRLELWMYDLRSRLLTRVAADGYRAAWTPDGKRIAYVQGVGLRLPNGRLGSAAMWVPADGSAAPEPIPGTDGLGALQIAFSADGKYVVIHVATGKERAFAIPLAGGPRIALDLDPTATEPAISPNGKWISYTSRSNSNRAEVVVQPFPAGTGRVQLTTNGGMEGKWSRDGTRLFYRTNTAIRALTLDISGAMPRVVRSDSLFPNVWVSNSTAFSWDVAPDGKRFVMRREVGHPRMVVEKNWLPEIEAKLRGRR